MRVGPFGIWELLIILVIVLLLFGARRLPDMAKGIGQAIKEFRKGVKDVQDDLEGTGTTASQSSANSSATTNKDQA